MFKFPKEELDEDFKAQLNFLNKVTEKAGSESFKNICQIDLDNLRDYLIVLLKAFEKGDISVYDMGEVGDALHIYIHRRYKEDYPDTCYPNPPESDPLFVSLNVIDYMNGFVERFLMFPEDASFFIQMLEAPPEQAKETNEKIYAYAKQFDRQKRLQEAYDRGLM